MVAGESLKSISRHSPTKSPTVCALRRGQQRTAAAAIDPHRAQLLTPFLAALVAAPAGHPQAALAAAASAPLVAHAQAARHAGAAPSSRPRAPGRLQRISVGGQLRHLVEAGRRVLRHGVAVERLEDGVVLVAPAAHLNLAAVGLGEVKVSPLNGVAMVMLLTCE